MGHKAEEKGCHILYHHAVKTIHTENGKVTSVVCETPEGSKTITGDIFISSMPIQDLIAGMDGCDNTEVQRIAAGLPYGTLSPWDCW